MINKTHFTAYKLAFLHAVEDTATQTADRADVEVVLGELLVEEDNWEGSLGQPWGEDYLVDQHSPGVGVEKVDAL